MQYGLIEIIELRDFQKEDNLVMSTQEVLMHIESAELFFKVTFYHYLCFSQIFASLTL